MEAIQANARARAARAVEDAAEAKAQAAVKARAQAEVAERTTTRTHTYRIMKKPTSALQTWQQYFWFSPETQTPRRFEEMAAFVEDALGKSIKLKSLQYFDDTDKTRLMSLTLEFQPGVVVLPISGNGCGKFKTLFTLPEM